tara:strand:- start:790 stop:939 length:150 start_codon:yes stop_codon:yes gene_type:complete
MQKLIGDKMGKYQWENAMELKYDTMPTWYWNPSLREKAYQNYLKDKSYE